MTFWESLALALAAGAAGGAISHWLAIRQFKAQHRFTLESEYALKRLQALRDIFSETPEILRGLYSGWDHMDEDRLAELSKKLMKYTALFRADTEVFNAIGVIDHGIGIDPSELAKTHPNIKEDFLGAVEVLGIAVERYEEDLGVG